MSNLETEVKILQKDLVTFQNINKLTEVSNNLNKVIAVQDSRIDTQEKAIEIVHKRITDMKDEIHEELSDHYQVILEKIKELQVEQKIHADEMSKRVDALEKWRYIVMGGAVALGFLLSKVGIIDSLF
jgi:putative NADH-flavin reductase